MRLPVTGREPPHRLVRTTLPLLAQIPAPSIPATTPSPFFKGGLWEQGRVILFRGHRAAVARLLRLSVAELAREMGARWAGSHVQHRGTSSG